MISARSTIVHLNRMTVSFRASIALALGLGIIGFDSQFKPTNAASISFTDFSNVSAWQLNGAAAQSGTALRVTPATFSQAGSGFVLNPFTFSADTSFDAYFQFQITSPGGLGGGADGLVFALQSNGTTALGSGGGGLGIGGIPNSVAIEFDTFDNGSVDGNNNNHIGLDLNGDINSVVRSNFPSDFKSGGIFYAWIDYNGLTNDLEVRLSTTNTRPASSDLAANIDLLSYLSGGNAYVGFTAGTGAGYTNQDILSFTFNTKDVPGPLPVAGAAIAFSYSRKLRNRIKASKVHG
ncbi:MAG: hypothetical protein RLZZ609_2954 [Cyanobacteriota bacterium]|jgi:hypothetical protein